jgi:hypothetical protein
MSVARHPRPKELEGVPVEEIMKKFVGRFSEKRADWAAFEDAKIEGFKRAQHRFIGAGGSGKHDDPTVIPAKNFTLSIMYVEPGQGNAATCSSRTRPASASPRGSAHGNASRARPASSTATRTTAWSRCISRS